MGTEDGSVHCGNPPTPELVVKCCVGHLCNLNISLQSPIKGEGSANRQAISTINIQPLVDHIHAICVFNVLGNSLSVDAL